MYEFYDLLDDLVNLLEIPIMVYTLASDSALALMHLNTF